MSIDAEQLLEDRTTHRHEVVGEHALTALVEWRIVEHISNALKKSENVLAGTHLTITLCSIETHLNGTGTVKIGPVVRIMRTRRHFWANFRGTNIDDSKGEKAQCNRYES